MTDESKCVVTVELRQLLEILPPCAETYSCLKAVYVFGSVARGDANPMSDLDIAIECVDDLTDNHRAMQSFNLFQRHVRARKKLLSRIIGRNYFKRRCDRQK